MATQYTAGLTQGQVLTADIMNQIGASWESWTPQLYQNANLTSTIYYAKYARINKFVVGNVYLTATQNAGGAGVIQIRNLPVTAASENGISGSWVYLDTGVAWYAGSVAGLTTTSLQFFYDNAGGNFGNITVIANTDLFRFGFFYEAA